MIQMLGQIDRWFGAREIHVIDDPVCRSIHHDDAQPGAEVYRPLRDRINVGGIVWYQSGAEKLILIKSVIGICEEEVVSGYGRKERNLLSLVVRRPIQHIGYSSDRIRARKWSTVEGLNEAVRIGDRTDDIRRGDQIERASKCRPIGVPGFDAETIGDSQIVRLVGPHDVATRRVAVEFEFPGYDEIALQSELVEVRVSFLGANDKRNSVNQEARAL